MIDDDLTPKPTENFDVTKLELSAEEGFVLSRIDGRTDVRAIAQLTGMGKERVSDIVARLAEQGAVNANTAFDPSKTVRDLTPVFDASEEDTDHLIGELEGLLDSSEEGDTFASAVPADVFDEKTEAGDADTDEGPPDIDTAEDAENDEEEVQLDEGNYRKLYHQLYAEQDTDHRYDAAHKVSGAKLLALCFDPDPGVIRAVLESTHSTLDHARLIAAHHRTGVGLSHIARQHRSLRDAQVQRYLLRNVQSPDPLLTKVIGNKPLLVLFKLVVSRENSSRAKRALRQAFRRRFTTAPSDEKVTLIFKTEARCMNSLVGLTLDSKTCAMITSRNIVSTIMIQNLLRFPATPPMVLTHLAKQAAVRRAPHLKKLVLQHPNCPSALKRARR